ncbi:1,2-phenylacetyl-CoA epoxidase subunit PaaB [Burkholderia plantarii]|uniref:Phenylacetate-CoA oxygenase, PaaB subunit n=1 Tax=Burkholderia plantarii TaxID=41899 RepID=A0A0B6S503_BURPL|nr:1,2-phenylacetyl-CoA epoxidase subunit PaaB [Burkholderia plantarii]AJK49484.1 phenylacetate-CoA oxygenase, PaaB subunit [Burkholderia plantarii]ALK33719.1 Phenylacetate-CoA oxygenase subunit PaaH [Burkholderia plantarii]WLE62738.1 1,2-phenylacetyl-CoA epoxidase subunit B [Burkholderia plantarii]GLZ16893.1 phenylacetate-CoA oxygenase subunit PaaB [Burkholderia plantarii]
MADWKLWEVFARSQNGVAHRHVGSVQATDAEMALQHARDVYTRRGEGVSLWLVASEHLVTSDPGDKAAWFASSQDKAYRHATFFQVPEGVQNL